MPYLDRLDPLAKKIGAVNTIGRNEAGELVGYNTDAVGGLFAMTKNVIGSQRTSSGRSEWKIGVVTRLRRGREGDGNVPL